MSPEHVAGFDKAVINSESEMPPQKSCANICIIGEPSISQVQVREHILQSNPFNPEGNIWGSSIHRFHGPVLTEAFVLAAVNNTFPRSWETDSIWRFADSVNNDNSNIYLTGPSQAEKIRNKIQADLQNRKLLYDSYRISPVPRLSSKTDLDQSGESIETYRIAGSRHVSMPHSYDSYGIELLPELSNNDHRVLTIQYNCLSAKPQDYFPQNACQTDFKSCIALIEDRRISDLADNTNLLSLNKLLLNISEKEKDDAQSYVAHDGLLSAKSAVTIVKAEDLRRQGYPISKGLSWERTAQTVIEALTKIHREVQVILKERNKSLQDSGEEFTIEAQRKLESSYMFLGKSRHIIISMAPDAVMYILQGVNGIERAILYADASDIEGGLFAKAPGRTRGYDTALLASISYHIATLYAGKSNEDVELIGIEHVSEKLQLALNNGLVASRYLHLRGFTQVHQACASRMSLLSDKPLDYTIIEPKGSLAPLGQTSKGLYYPIDPVGHIIREKNIDDITWVPNDLLSYTAQVRDEYYKGKHSSEKEEIDLKPLLFLLTILSKSLDLVAVCTETNAKNCNQCSDFRKFVNELKYSNILSVSGVIENSNAKLQLSGDKGDIDKYIFWLQSIIEGCVSHHAAADEEKILVIANWIDKLRSRNRPKVQVLIRDLMSHIRSDFQEADRISELEIPYRIIDSVQKRRIGLERESDPISKRLLHQGYFDSTWWSFLGERVIESAESSSRGRICEEEIMMEIAEAYLKKGATGISDRKLVSAKYGSFISYNRAEIEGIRNVASIIRTYLERSGTGQDSARPLNLAVFGPPGAGKGYAVNAVIRSLSLESIAKEKLTFNVSQFKDPSEIFQALHTVRDVAIKGKVPLVFWDEYDTSFNGEAFGWLRYFIGPMWDGVFQEGQLTRPIGRAIFVFAGSRFTSQLSLEAGLILDRENLLEISNDMPQELRLFHDFKAAKGLDFKSRLLGYLDIMDVNPTLSVPEVLDYAKLVLNRQQTSDIKHVNMRSDYGLGRHLDPGWRDYYLLRRALLLRSELERSAPTLFSNGSRGTLNIEQAVQNSFLRARRYHHGARSLSAIVQMSNLEALRTYEMSALPGGEQMRLHVEPSEFESSYEDFDK
ncbi:MAG: hypothetical protein KF824_01395 [Fimbriimonadaceae bacterium]|nr:MAG: hypothetical protein KF824_01395 [Fimbriimonadaceae bacterium]